MGSHAADLELARRCAAGEPAAWDHFVREYRPVLYRAADSLDPNGGAREIADSLYAELYGLRSTGSERRSLLLSFSGRSSLATWLRAVLCQRFVDRIRAQRRLEPLPVEELADPERVGLHPERVGLRHQSEGGLHHRSEGGLHHRSEPADRDRARYVELVRQALGRAIGQLGGRDRLRLSYYYVQDLTLAEIGRLLDEHEATVSRQLTRTRRTLREALEHELRDQAGLSEAQIAECFASVAADPGPLDLQPLFTAGEVKSERSA
jgi:RNA polymerase sigma factor (sigma-70 family)